MKWATKGDVLQVRLIALLNESTLSKQSKTMALVYQARSDTPCALDLRDAA
jgi:hypothetical protein